MKRMIDLKEFLQLQALAMSTQQLASDNEKRLDDLEDVYTYSNLAIDDGDFDFIDPASPENFQPVSLVIGDHVYIDGEQTDLTAEMIAEIYDSNLVVLSCGDAPTTYPNVILQRQFIDPASGALSPKSARFEAFVTLDSTVYHYTMIVTRYDSTSEEGGSIVLACTEAATKPVYCHPISIDDNSSTNKIHIACLIFDNSPVEYNTINKFKVKLEEIFAINKNAVFPITGAIYYSDGAALHVAQKIGYDENIGIQIYTSRPDGTQGNFTFTSYLINATFYDGVNRIN